MSSFWRRFCKAMFYFSFVMSEIVVLILSVCFFTNEEVWGIGLLVLIFGGFIMVMIHAFFGAALEQMYNIAELRDKYCGIRLSERSKRSFVENYSADKPWDCPECRTINEPENQCCSACGFKLNEIIGNSQTGIYGNGEQTYSSGIICEDDDGLWMCTNCRAINECESKRCKKCGYIKR